MKKGISATSLVLFGILFIVLGCGTGPELDPETGSNGDYLLFESDFVFGSGAGENWILISDLNGNALAQYPLSINGPVNIFGPSADSIIISFINLTEDVGELGRDQINVNSYIGIPTGITFERNIETTDKPDSLSEIGEIYFEIIDTEYFRDPRFGIRVFVEESGELASDSYPRPGRITENETDDGLYKGKLMVYSDSTNIHWFSMRDKQPVYNSFTNVQIGDTLNFSMSDFNISSEIIISGEHLLNGEINGIPYPNSDIHSHQISSDIISYYSNQYSYTEDLILGYIDIFDWYESHAEIISENEYFELELAEYQSISRNPPADVIFPDYQIEVQDYNLSSLSYSFNQPYTYKKGRFVNYFEYPGGDSYITWYQYGSEEHDFRTINIPDEILSQFGFNTEIDLILKELEIYSHQDSKTYLDAFRDKLEYKSSFLGPFDYFKYRTVTYSCC